MTDIKAAEVKKASSWSTEQEAQIAKYQETLGMSRSHAVRKMRAEEAKANKPASAKEVNTLAVKMAKQAVKAVAKAKKAVAKEEGHAKSQAKHAITPQRQAAVDKVVRECAGKAAVEVQLKSSLNPAYSVYQYFGLSDGNVCHVNIGEKITAHLIPADRGTVKAWKRKRAERMKRAEAKLAAAKKETK